MKLGGSDYTNGEGYSGLITSFFSLLSRKTLICLGVLATLLWPDGLFPGTHKGEDVMKPTIKMSRFPDNMLWFDQYLSTSYTTYPFLLCYPEGIKPIHSMNIIIATKYCIWTSIISFSWINYPLKLIVHADSRYTKESDIRNGVWRRNSPWQLYCYEQENIYVSTHHLIGQVFVKSLMLVSG